MKRKKNESAQNIKPDLISQKSFPEYLQFIQI